MKNQKKLNNFVNFDKSLNFYSRIKGGFNDEFENIKGII